MCVCERVRSEGTESSGEGGECLRSPGLYVAGNRSRPDESLPGACGQGACGWAGEQSRVLAKAKDANLRGQLLLLQAYREPSQRSC